MNHSYNPACELTTKRLRLVIADEDGTVLDSAGSDPDTLRQLLRSEFNDLNWTRISNLIAGEHPVWASITNNRHRDEPPFIVGGKTINAVMRKLAEWIDSH